MKLSKEIRDCVSVISLKHLGRKHDTNFSCITFVREVYKEICIEVPTIGPYLPPPAMFNITKKDLDRGEHGYIVFLLRKDYVGRRTWTHVAITLQEEKIIHSSHYFDGEVSTNSKEEIFDFYQYVP